MSEPGALPAEGPSDRLALIVFDFDGVFTDNTVWTDASGNELVRSWRGDGIGIQRIRECGIPLFVLSTEVNPVVRHRCEKLGIPSRHGIHDKGAALRELIAELRVDPRVTVYVGNDVNDRTCLLEVGYGIVVADAHPDVVSVARYRTRAAGGFGAVREVCDWIANAPGVTSG